jgi:hypothetical protein
MLWPNVRDREQDPEMVRLLGEFDHRLEALGRRAHELVALRQDTANHHSRLELARAIEAIMVAGQALVDPAYDVLDYIEPPEPEMVTPVVTPPPAPMVTPEMVTPEPMVTDVVTPDKPSKAKRDRAAYMRDYRAKAILLGSTALAGPPAAPAQAELARAA